MHADSLVKEMEISKDKFRSSWTERLFGTTQARLFDERLTKKKLLNSSILHYEDVQQNILTYIEYIFINSPASLVDIYVYIWTTKI